MILVFQLVVVEVVGSLLEGEGFGMTALGAMVIMVVAGALLEVSM